MTGVVTVTVAQGALAGREESSKCQKTYYSFRGVPYAKPPVGPLRFKVSVLNPCEVSTGYLRQAFVLAMANCSVQWTDVYTTFIVTRQRYT